MSRLPGAVIDILRAIRERGALEAGSDLWVHYGYRAWLALTERERELFRSRFPGRPDPLCQCDRCEEDA